MPWRPLVPSPAVLLPLLAVLPQLLPLSSHPFRPVPTITPVFVLLVELWPPVCPPTPSLPASSTLVAELGRKVPSCTNWCHCKLMGSSHSWTCSVLGNPFLVPHQQLFTLSLAVLSDLCHCHQASAPRPAWHQTGDLAFHFAGKIEAFHLLPVSVSGTTVCITQSPRSTAWGPSKSSSDFLPSVRPMPRLLSFCNKYMTPQVHALFSIPVIFKQKYDEVTSH